MSEVEARFKVWGLMLHPVKNRGPLKNVRFAGIFRAP